MTSLLTIRLLMRWIRGCIAFSMMLFSLSAHAEDVVAKYKWNQDPIVFYYNPEGQPDWLSTEEALKLLRLTAAAWEVCGPRIPIEGISLAKPSARDNKNVIGWVDNTAMRSLYDKSFNGVTKVTASTKFQQNKSKAPSGFGLSWMNKGVFIVEYDILFNSTIFSRDTTSVRKELYHNMLHELGHAIAFNGIHTQDRAMVMSTDQKSVDDLPVEIHPQEIAACQKLYGKRQDGISPNGIHQESGENAP